MSRCLLKCSIEKLPVSVNRIWRNARGGGVYKSEKARMWQDVMIAIMRAARKYPTYKDDVKMILTITRRDRRRYDIDNRIKTVQDCLAPAGVIIDDAQVVELHCFKRTGKADLCEVEIWMC